jgi:DNA-binding MarR family transcriptional regulator
MPEISLSEFAENLNKIMPVLMKEFARRQANELYKGKITLPQFLILEFLQQEGISKMVILARVMQVSTAAMTGMVNRLVKYGYVSRIYDPLDRRIIKVKLTASGSTLLKRTNQQRRQMVIKIFGQISAADRQDYLRILTQIKEILSEDISYGAKY